MSDLPEKDNNLNENTENISNEEDGASTVFSDPADHKKTAVKQKRRLLPIIISAVLAVAVLAGGTVAVIKLIPEREDDTSTPSVETIKVLDKSSDDFKTVTVTNKSFIPKRKRLKVLRRLRILQAAAPKRCGILTGTQRTL